MLPLIAMVVGLTFFVGGILWLWYMLAKPKPWARFTEAENAFWVRRGLPVRWAGACKEFEQGRGLKLLVAFCIFAAAVFDYSVLRDALFLSSLACIRVGYDRTADIPLWAYAILAPVALGLLIVWQIPPKEVNNA
jgi:hypothetical protein